MKTIGAKVEDEIYAVFRLVCEKDGVNVSDRLKDLVSKFVKEEAPYLVLDEKIYLELKRIAEEKGLDWKKMVCDSILAFCKKCSEEKEAKTETEKEKEAKTSTEKEEKPKETVTLTHLNGTEEEVPKDRIKILKESVL